MTSDECKEMSPCSSFVIRHSSVVIRHLSLNLLQCGRILLHGPRDTRRPRRICSMQKFAIGVVFLCLLPLAAMAQDTPKAEVFGGYSYLRVNELSGLGIGLNLNGWNGSVTGNVNDWFGVKADFSGQYG